MQYPFSNRMKKVPLLVFQALDDHGGKICYKYEFGERT